MMNETRIYHERQDSSLCGVHCLNSLLQGSYFTAVDLANIAHELDKAEKNLMREMGHDTVDFLKYMAEDSGNVADNGNYSVQVLEKALSMFNLACIPITNPEAKGAFHDPLGEQAFICNLSGHWFTLRRIDHSWFDLNSTKKNPEPLSDTYLSLYLRTLSESGWSIFVVRGNIPPVTNSTLTSDGGRWYPISKCVKPPPQQRMATLGTMEGDDLISSSTGGGSATKGGGGGGMVMSSEDAELAEALALSLGHPGATVPSPLRHSEVVVIDDEDEDWNNAEVQKAMEDSELEAAIAASLLRP
eukprot:TRINITY_DN4177_c2_g4_i1.p1 TRINITY_DN4177_c2_g4~~TRINITY_DN4177_c2_g4_i1.p1  ORF type:complete len:301 (-),score=78.58 TRINITY_DN4177_c2_g4_i1:138-1040(-)